MKINNLILILITPIILCIAIIDQYLISIDGNFLVILTLIMIFSWILLFRKLIIYFNS